MLGEYDAGYESCIDSLIRDIENAQTENEKLRELVGMMSKAIGVTVDNCHGDCIGPYECTLYGGCPIQKLMRKLGVEAD